MFFDMTYKLLYVKKMTYKLFICQKSDGMQPFICHFSKCDF